MTFRYIISLFAMNYLLIGCVASQNLPDSSYKANITESPVFKNNHTGFALYELATRQPLIEYQSDKYFTPASNTKLFTFYAGLCMLGDSVSALKYVVQNDSLLFWGTGDPSLIHPDLPKSNALDFLKSWQGKLYYLNQTAQNDKFGVGWSWDDYNAYYQTEITKLPVYGNIVRFKNKANQFSISPKVFQDSTILLSEANFTVDRVEHKNQFKLNTARSYFRTYEIDIPFRTSTAMNIKLLSDYIQKPIQVIQSYGHLNLRPYKVIKSVPADSLYQRMLQFSDNMLAEQIMMLCDAEKDSTNRTISTISGIETAKKQLLSYLPDETIWVDGSGLSRHNLFTPRTIVHLLFKIYDQIPQERLFSLLAIGGGKNGTLRNMFKSEIPYVFAKTGSLSNNYSLSGYLKTKQGKLFVFSFMNTHYVRPTSEIRAEVERILTDIHEKY